MKRRKFQSTVYLEQHQHDELRRLSEVTKVPWSEFVRDAIGQWLSNPPEYVRSATERVISSEGSEETGA